MIENPVSTLGSYWRRPDFSFHPNEFGGYEGGEADDYVKRTCLWTGAEFRFPPKREIPAFRPFYIHNMPPSGRARKSSERHAAGIRAGGFRGERGED